MHDSVQALARDLRRYLEHLQSLGIEQIVVEPVEEAPSATDAASRRGQSGAPDDQPTPTAVEGAAKSGETREGGSKAKQLAGLARAYANCRDCKLAQLGRRQVVYGVGNPDAELMFIGEGPGADEDAQGEPFVGKAGQLLTRIIQAMGMRREDVYIANIVKCRPPNNRNPESDEIDACFPKLREQIEIVAPRVICALGKVAFSALCGSSMGITRARGHWHEYDGIPVMPTFHPSYLLRDTTGSEKRLVWEDMQAILRRLGRTPPAR